MTFERGNLFSARISWKNRQNGKKTICFRCIYSQTHDYVCIMKTNRAFLLFKIRVRSGPASMVLQTRFSITAWSIVPRDMLENQAGKPAHCSRHAAGGNAYFALSRPRKTFSPGYGMQSGFGVNTSANPSNLNAS